MRASSFPYETQISLLAALVTIAVAEASCDNARGAHRPDAGPIDDASVGIDSTTDILADAATADVHLVPDAIRDEGNGDRPDWHDIYAMCGFPPCLATLFALCPIATPTEAAQNGACVFTQVSDSQVHVVYASGTFFLTSRTAGLDTASSTVYKPNGDFCYKESGFGPSTITDQQGRTVAEFTFDGTPSADITCDGHTTRVLNDCVDLLITPEAGGYFCSKATTP